jgi:hypothetical protein
MKRNVGTIDKVVRLTLVGLIGIAYFAHAISGTAAIVLGALALVFLATSAASICPLYLPLNLSTRGK